MTVSHRSRRAAEILRRQRVARRLSHKTAVQLLGRTHTFAVGEAIPIQEEAVRAAEVTFRFRILMQPNFINPIPKGILFCIGSEDVGVAAWITEEWRLGFGAGTRAVIAPIPGQPWTQAETPASTLPFTRNARMDLAFSVRPGDGTIRAWLNGRRVIASRANLGRFVRVGTSFWAAARPGGYFVLPPEIPRFCPITTLANADIVGISPMSMFVKQRPWHYDTGPQDPGSGPLPPP